MKGQVVVTPVGAGEPRVIAMAQAKLAAAHPKGAWLVIVDNLNRLHVVDVGSGRVIRTHHVGGRYVPTDQERQFVASFLSASSITDPNAVQRQALEKEKALERLARAGLPRGVSIEDMRKQLEELMVKLPAAVARQSAVKANSGAEKVFRTRFDRDGEWLFVATMAGARVYAWRDILEAEELRPSLSTDVPATMVETDHGPIQREGYVYDLDHDTDRNRLLFAGLDGRVRYLDLGSGKSGVLLEPPGLPPIQRLELSRDRATLALTCSPATFGRGTKVRGPVLQFWDYEAISRR
jgi:hypothetical protein